MSLWGDILGLVGSTVGTAIAPGIGTAIGGSLGNLAGKTIDKSNSKNSTNGAQQQPVPQQPQDLSEENPLPLSSGGSNNIFQTAIESIPTIVGDTLRDKSIRDAQAESYRNYMGRFRDLSGFTQSTAPGLTTASLWNAAGDVGANAPQAYERALSRVSSTPDAALAYSQLLSNAGRLQSAAEASTMAARAAAENAQRGLARQAAQMARKTGSASSLRDIVGATAAQGAAAGSQIAEAGARAQGQNLANAGQMLATAPGITQQSQLAQYQLFARPRESQLSPIAATMLQQGVPYDKPVSKWQGMQNALYSQGYNQLMKILLGRPARLPGETGVTVGDNKM